MPKIILIVLISILIASIYILFFPKKAVSLKTKDFKIANQQFLLEIATSINDKATGLANRTNLCPNCGMIFIFNQDSLQTFWMKNTLIPLDIIFIDSSGKVSNIETAVPEPGVNDFSLKLYRSSKPVMYVIELNAGISKELGLKAGDPIDLSPLELP